MNSEVTYCLLAEIKSRKSNVASLIEIFQELVETLFAHYYPDGEIAGQLADLRRKYIDTFGIEIPYPTLKIILSNLKSKYNEKMDLFDDYSFHIEVGTVESNVVEIRKSEDDISDLDKLYQKHCSGNANCADLYAFIEQSKRELIAFVTDPLGFTPDSFDQSTVEFLNLILGLSKYRAIFEKLLMGSIISSYFDIGMQATSNQKTLLLDTNFVVSLMDLHSEDSLVTTEAILKIAVRSGYKLQVLPETLKETTNLLKHKADVISKVNIFSSQKKHTVEYGCARKKIKRDELLVYAERVREFVEGKEIEIVSEEKNAELCNGIETTDIYQSLIRRPFNKEGVPHDAVAMKYVREIRNPTARNISEVDAFFVTDTAGFLENKVTSSTRLPYVIRAEELLNILWLASPVFDSSMIISNIARIMTLHLDKKLPDKEMLRRIDEKLDKFADLGLDLEACAALAINIAEADSRQLNDLLDIDEKGQFKEKILELALAAKASKDENDKRRIKEYDELLVFLEEEKELERTEALVAMEQGLLDMRSKYDDYSRLQERKHNEELLVRDREVLVNIDETINDLNGRCLNRERLVFSPFIIASVCGLIYLAVTKIIPHWSSAAPFTYIIGLAPLVFTGLIYVLTGRTIKWSTAIERIRQQINKTLYPKIDQRKSDRERVRKRIGELEKRIANIIE